MSADLQENFVTFSIMIKFMSRYEQQVGAQSLFDRALWTSSVAQRFICLSVIKNNLSVRVATLIEYEDKNWNLIGKSFSYIIVKIFAFV